MNIVCKRFLCSGINIGTDCEINGNKCTFVKISALSES